MLSHDQRRQAEDGHHTDQVGGEKHAAALRKSVDPIDAWLLKSVDLCIGELQRVHHGKVDLAQSDAIQRKNIRHFLKRVSVGGVHLTIHAGQEVNLILNDGTATNRGARGISGDQVGAFAQNRLAHAVQQSALLLIQQRWHGHRHLLGQIGSDGALIHPQQKLQHIRLGSARAASGTHVDEHPQSDIPNTQRGTHNTRDTVRTQQTETH